MRVTVDPDTCTGCGLCVDACPEVFELNDDGLAVVKTTPVPAELEGPCRDAADSCPVDAISIADVVDDTVSATE